jgi:hypothetical protein
MIVRILNTEDVYRTYFITNNTRCVMLWAAQAYTRIKHSTKWRLWAGRRSWRGGKQGRKYVRPGVLETTINSSLNHIKRPSPYRTVNTHYPLFKKTSHIMLNREIIAACKQFINTMCGQNVALVNVKTGGTDTHHWAVKGFCAVEDSLPL